MKKLIVLLGFILSFQVMAQEEGWRTKGRSLFTSMFSEGFASKVFGPTPEIVKTEYKLPEVPTSLKKNTDASSYTKLSKPPTEFDKLPKEKQRKFDYMFIQELFKVTRKSEAKDEDLSNWLNVLNQGGSREGIYQALTVDEVYATLEEVNEKPSEKLLNFCLSFSQRFLNQTFKKESLEKLNHFSLKRIHTEKGLDLIEHYEGKNLEDLYQWYAIFSAELASEYAPLLKSEVRKDPRVEYHLEWARSMPIQHIKSEFIIKIHTVMNGLQLLEG